MSEDNFYVQVKNSETFEVVKEIGPISARDAVKLANAMDINMSEKFYTEVVEK